MERRFRLTRSTDIKRVRSMGKSYAHPLIVLLVAASEKQEKRIGIIAGRSVGGAVQRNRAKRLMRASLNPLLPEINQGWDMLLLARHGVDGASFTQVQNAIVTLLQRAQLVLARNHVHRS